MRTAVLAASLAFQKAAIRGPVPVVARKLAARVFAWLDQRRVQIDEAK